MICDLFFPVVFFSKSCLVCVMLSLSLTDAAGTQRWWRSVRPHAMSERVQAQASGIGFKN